MESFTFRRKGRQQDFGESTENKQESQVFSVFSLHINYNIFLLSGRKNL